MRLRVTYFFKPLIVFASLVLLAIAAHAQTINYAKIEILTEQYTPNLYMWRALPVMPIPIIRTARADASACWSAPTASSWWILNTSR